MWPDYTCHAQCTQLFTADVASASVHFIYGVVSVLYSGPSLLEVKFRTKFVPLLNFLSGLYNNFQVKDERVLLCWRRTLGAGVEGVCVADESFIVGDERVENVRSNYSHTHS